MLIVTLESKKKLNVLRPVQQPGMYVHMWSLVVRLGGISFAAVRMTSAQRHVPNMYKQCTGYLASALRIAALALPQMDSFLPVRPLQCLAVPAREPGLPLPKPTASASAAVSVNGRLEVLSSLATMPDFPARVNKFFLSEGKFSDIKMPWETPSIQRDHMSVRQYSSYNPVAWMNGAGSYRFCGV